MKKRRKILSLLLCMTLAISMMPMTGFAADTGKAIQFVDSGNPTGGISGYDSAARYDYIYYGNWTAQGEHTTSGPIKWRVLDTKTNMENAAEGDGLFLLSDGLLGTGDKGDVYFDNSGNNSNVWRNSTAQTWCNNFYGSSFSNGEQGAVLATTKSDEAFNSSTYNEPFTASENILNGDKVFFLSAEEAENSTYGFTDDNARIANYGNNAGVWWLRSSHEYRIYDAGAVDGYGIVYDDGVAYDFAARPAFNLNLNSVLFTSAAKGGKPEGGLQAVEDYTGSEWKLTLLDVSRQFAVAEDAASSKPGDTITMNYTGATTGTNEYISAIIADNSGAQYYGRIAQPNTADGQIEIKIPPSLADGTYTLHVFSEQYNGDYKTDYASAFEAVALTVEDTSTPPIENKAIQLVDSGTAANISGGQASNV